MPSLPTFANLWRRLRNPDASDKSPTPSKQDRARSAEVAAAATTDRIRRVVQVSRVPPESPEEAPADASTQSPEPSPSPAAPQTTGPQGSTRQLWGREFSVTEGGGLSQEQVAEFVEQLLARNRNLEEQGPPAAMSNYVQKLMGELQNVEESIQSQARRDAEAEAAKITADASRKAQETITRARTEATELAQREAEGILAQARKKAEIADSQIRIQAQLMLGKVREQIEARIQQEGETAYNRLLASLTNLNQEVQRIESEWKQERAQLWRGDDVKLALGATGLSALPIIQEVLSPTVGEATPAPDATPPQAEPPETPEQPPVAEAELQPLEVTEPPETPEEAPAAEAELQPLEVEVVEPPETPEETPVAEAELQPLKVEEPPETPEEAPAPVMDEVMKNALYGGEIELALAPLVDPALLARLYSGLLALPNIQILRSVGSWDGGTAITLMLESPQPLVGLLLGISEVQILIESGARGPDGTQTDAGGGLMVPGNQINISLRA